MEAFQRAVDMGYHYLETDIRATRDGVCVAFHDKDLHRVTGRRGAVHTTTWQELRRLRVLDSGQVPRLVELLETWPDVRWMLDLKQPSALPALVAAVRMARATERICLAGSWDGCLTAAREHLGPGLTTALGWRALAHLVWNGGPRHSGPTFAHVPLTLGGRRIPTPRLVDRAHTRGLRLLAWGVDDTREMRRVLDDGLDGVITDRTDLLREVMIARGQWKRGSETRPAESRRYPLTPGRHGLVPFGSRAPDL